MKTFLLLMSMLLSGKLYSQTDNSLSIRGNLAKLYATYNHGKYRKNVDVWQNPTLSYRRKIKNITSINFGDLFWGPSIGLRDYYLNETDMLSGLDINHHYRLLNIGLNFRSENYLSRRSKFFLEIGAGWNTGLNSIAVDYYDNRIKQRKLASALEMIGYGGYQYMLNKKWYFEIGTLSYQDLISNMKIKDRKVKFLVTSLVTSVNYTF